MAGVWSIPSNLVYQIKMLNRTLSSKTATFNSLADESYMIRFAVPHPKRASASFGSTSKVRSHFNISITTPSTPYIPNSNPKPNFRIFQTQLIQQIEQVHVKPTQPIPCSTLPQNANRRSRFLDT